MTSMPLDGNRRSSTTPAAGLTPTTNRLSNQSNNDPNRPGNEPLEGNDPMAGIAIMEQIREERKKQEWASWANSEFAKCKNARAPFERQWYLNLAFLSGKHYVSPVEVPGQGFRLTAPNAPAWRVRLVINKIRSAHKRECAKLSSSRPIPTVVPSTNEDEDFSAARVAEQILKNAFSTADFERTYRSWIWWGGACGVSFLKSYWAPNEPDPDLMQPQQPKMGMDGQPLRDDKGEVINEDPKPIMGKITVERITPFHIYVPDLLAEDLNKQPYIIHCTTRSPLWVKRYFGFMPNPDTRASSTIMESAFLLTKGSEQILDSVLVKEVWLKPFAHPDFPRGGMLTVINDKVVQYKDDWPWPFPEYPFYKYDNVPTGGFYSDSNIVDLIPLNKEYNRTRSQMIEIKNTMGRPKLLYPRGSINPRQISSEPGQGIPYTPGFDKPTVMDGAQVPQSMHMELERLSSDFDDISGQHEITRGGNPTGVTSGTAISFLQEQDDVGLTYPVAAIEYAIEMLGKHYLRYASHYWDNERLIKITGKDSAFEARMWKGSDLRGNTDVRVQSGSALPVSKAARQAMITEFMQYGWMDVPTGMELMSLGGFDKAIDEILVDKKQANRENLRMAELPPEQLQYLQQEQQRYEMEQQAYHEAKNAYDMQGAALQAQAGPPPVGPDGQPLPQEPINQGPPPMQPRPPEPPIPVNSWDNHEAHVQFHNQFRKSQQFELLDPAIKQAFELHVQMHQMALQVPQMGQLGMVSGAPDPMMEQSLAQGDQQMQQGQEAHQQQMGAQDQQNNLDQALKMAQIGQAQSRQAYDYANVKKIEGGG